jgi:hypothetical protein
VSGPTSTRSSPATTTTVAAVAVTNHTAYPVWSDTRPVDLFLCPGTGTTSTPPAVCQGGATNASVANDQDIYTVAVPIR